MSKRLIIPVSFDNENDYIFVKNKPNSSHYIRELVKKDRKNIQQDKKYLEDKVKELKKYIDEKISNNKTHYSNEFSLETDIQNDVKSALGVYD